MNVGPFTLRPHQVRMVEGAREAVRQGKRRIMVRSPTGAGKTLASSKIISLALERLKRVLFLAPARQLIYQKSRKLTECGIPHAVLMAGEEYVSGHGCVVSSKDTLWARGFRTSKVSIHRPDIIIPDEAQLASEGLTWQKIYEAFPDAIIIGFSATPSKGNGEALTGWDVIVDGGTYEELIAAGFLVPAKVFAPYVVDMEGVAVNPNNGEYVQEQMASRFDDKVLVGDFIEHWIRLGENRLTAFFASSVRASIGAAEQFNAAGIPAVHMDADTPPEEREEIFRRAKAGEIKVICNYAVLRVGVDLPEIECIQLAVAMNSIVQFIQTVGRGGRICTFPDGRVKEYYILIDHGGNVHKHGWPTEDHEWSLSNDKTVQERDEIKATQEKKQREPICCPECGAMREGGPQCPNCGHQHKRTGLKVRTVSGELKPLTRKKVKQVRLASQDQKAWENALGIAVNANMTISQARIMFKNKKGYWPPEGLGSMPDASEWGVKAKELYPNYGRRKKGGDA